MKITPTPDFSGEYVEISSLELLFLALAADFYLGGGGGAWSQEVRPK